MPFDEEKHIQQLVEIYRRGFEEILRVLVEKEVKGQWTLYWRDVMLEVRAILRQLDAYADTWIEQVIGQVYSQAAAQTMMFLERLGKQRQEKPEFAQIHQRAIDVVAQNMVNNLRNATQFIGRRVNDVFRRVGLEQTARKLAAGQTVQDMKQKMVRQLLDEGQTAFVDRLGRKWRLDTYAAMVARTTTREASTVATLNTCEEFGVDLVQVTTHYPTCEKCAPLQGKVFSISGKDKRYPKYGENDAYIPRHPNCRHVLVPYVREFDDNAEETERFSNQPLDVDPRSEQEKQDYDAITNRKVIITHRQRARWELMNGAIPEDRKIDAARRLKRTYDITGQQPKGLDAQLLKAYFKYLEPEAEKLEHYVEIEGLTDKAKTGLATALKEVADFGQTRKRECVIHISAETGEQVFRRIEGEKERVVFPSELSNYLQNAPKNSVIMVHNHPNAASFSDADLDVALKYDSVLYSVVVDNEGTRYIFGRGNGRVIGRDSLGLFYNLYRRRYMHKFVQAVKAGQMTPEQAWREQSHLIIEAMAKDFGWFYRRVLKGES